MGEHAHDVRARKAWYNALSPYYDALVDPFQGRLRRRGIASLGVSAGDRVLDVGCGTGRGLATLADAVGPDGLVVGLDVADRMCRLASDRLEAASSAVVCGDALSIPFDADSFDAVLLSFTLELFDLDRQLGVLADIRRVLTPSGNICVVAPSATGVLVPPLYARLNDVVPTLVDSRPLDGRALLARTGFEVVRTATERVPIVPVELVVGRARPSTGDRP